MCASQNKVLIIDNYDSFTYNLVHYLNILGAKTQVIYNDELSLDQIKKLNFSQILISPGPGNPDDAGISLDLIDYYFNKVPILGVCLGHQCLAQYFGGKIVHAPKIMHGKCSIINHNGQGIFKDIPNNFIVTRYHSLVVDAECFPEDLVVTAIASKNPPSANALSPLYKRGDYKGEMISPFVKGRCRRRRQRGFSKKIGNGSSIMALQHKKYPIFGVQFHPEAVLSQYGLDLLSNFLDFK